VTSSLIDPAAERPPGAGYEDLVATLLGAQLALPPIPVLFRPDLERRGPWVWSTRPIDPMDMYMFHRYAEEALFSPVDDYVAINHAGHGANSYGLNYHLVYGPLALFTQNSWGGAYTDLVESQARVTATFRLAADLIASSESHRLAGDGRSGVQLVVAFSDFRSVSWWRLRSTEPVSDPDHTHRCSDAEELSLGSLFAEASEELRQLFAPM
jgi:hypothetical protein